MPVGLYPGANSATGNGVTTTFAYSFRIIAEADLKVEVDGVTKTLTTDYTVTGVGEANGGNVVFVAAPANAAAIVISRNRAYSRTTDYQRNGDFDEETVDADFDAAIMLIQQLYADRLRGFKAPISVTADQVLSAATWAARASKIFGFDSSGNFTLLAAADIDEALVSAFVETLLDDASADAFLETLVDALTAETAPATGDLVSISDVSANSGRKMTLANLLKVVNALTNDAAPAVDDELLMYSIVNAGARKVTFPNLLKVINALTAETSPAVDDLIALYDTSASSARKMTLLNLLKIVPNRVYSEYTANADLSTTIPGDDTIPQNTEGTEIQTVTITPRSTSSRIRIRWTGQVIAATGGANLIAALFQDSTASALRTTMTNPNDLSGYGDIIKLEHEHAPGTVSAITYKIRVGASSGTCRLNGTNSGRFFGGTSAATLVAEEIPA